MAEVTKKKVRPQQNRGGLGMELTAPARQELIRSGFRIRPAVSIVHQPKSKRWLLSGEEGGGSVKAIGHYVGYVGTNTDASVLSLPVQALLPNVIHRRVLSSSLIRFEIFRYEQSCELAITHLYLDPAPEGQRPRIARRELFRGRDGLLTADNPVPLFFSRSGELIELPEHITPGLAAVARGAQCINCRHAHLIGLPTIRVPVASTALTSARATAMPDAISFPVADATFVATAPAIPQHSGGGPIVPEVMPHISFARKRA